MSGSIQNQRRPQATLVDLISLIGGVAACSSAVVTGRDAGRLFISWIVGLLMGIACFWWTRVALKWMVFRLRLHEAKLSPYRLVLSWLVFITSILWIVASCFITAYVTKLLISGVK
jgi:hypothetical protein